MTQGPNHHTLGVLIVKAQKEHMNIRIPILYIVYGFEYRVCDMMMVDSIWHINIRILPTMISGIPLMLGSGTRM